MISTSDITPTLRNVYTVEQFAAEIFCGQRSYDWVLDQIRARRIKTVTRRPYLIPQAEALRVINGSGK